MACDKPIRVYVWGFIGLLCWFSWFQNLFIKHCLGFDPATSGPERPWRVQVYHVVWQLLNVGWNVLGLVWIVNSETCQKTAPQMFESARVLVFLQLTVYVLIALAMVALVWMVWAIRHGHGPKTNAAPEGFVDSLSVMEFDAALFDDDRYPKECSICYDPFKSEQGERAIVKTPCGHVYHKECIGNWLQSQRSCPICRTDMVDGEGEAPPPKAEEQV